MKRILGAALLAMMLLATAGCGSSSSPSFLSQIFSDPTVDGDISVALGGTTTITQAVNTQNVLAGVDPASGTEYRGFLDFPLTGATGVPGSAIVDSAFLDVYINSYQSTATSIPMRIELVSLSTSLQSVDFNSTPLVSTVVIFPVLPTDQGHHVSVDVTPLMQAAQRLNLQDFQVRILEDFGPPTPIDGLIEINDTNGVNQASLAPLLSVTYH